MNSSGLELRDPGWAPAVREGLERWLRAGAGKDLPVVFDFDNSIVCGDIGEATLAVLAREGRVTPRKVARAVAPDFTRPDGARVAMADFPDVTGYYEALLAASAHGANDPAPLATGYVWAVEAMAGLTVAEVLAATRAAFSLSAPGEERFVEASPGGNAYPAPFFYPAVVELLGALVRARFDVWVVSASNVWSVRWMVLRGLNPLLRAQGLPAGLRADHVLGVSTLLADAQNRWFKDAVLAREDAAYVAGEESALGALRLTCRLQFPPPVYSGKVACIWDALGRRPFLAVGDSPGDHAMLAFSEHRLWIARLEKPDYLRATLDLMRRTGADGWLVQPTLVRGDPGFVADLDTLELLLPRMPASVRASLAVLRGPVEER